MKKLPESEWIEVIRNAVLVSFDLLVHDEDGRYLLGYRRNSPAKDTWFTLGSAIRKNETLDNGFSRCIQDELGFKYDVDRKSTYHGIYEHIYEDNFLNKEFGTHYIVIAHKFQLPHEVVVKNLPVDQHSNYCWMKDSEILSSSLVHENVKLYFK